jgi:tripartite-type tricarboxylate transporter receptor subunit TctC
MIKKTSWLVATAVAMTFGGTAQADWKPTKPVEFVVTSSPGGGTDNFARVVQSIIAKHKLMEQPVVVTNKGGGSGAEGFIYAKVATGDAHKLTFGTNNAYLLPYVAKLAYKADELTPVAAMALDEFLLWVNASSPHKDAKSYIEAVKAKPETFKMGGSQSKDTDQTLTSLIQDSTGAKFIYVPFQAVQLAFSSLVVISTPTLTIRTRMPASGRLVRSRHCASSALRACRKAPRSRRPWGGRTSRPARKLAFPLISSRCRAPCGCRVVFPLTLRRSMPVFSRR